MSMFDLDEARRLHDRNPDDPYHCNNNCTDERDDPERWPCRTARVLGATGNSEWTGPDDLTRRLEAAMHPDITGAGIFTIPKIITFNPDTERVLPDGRVITTEDQPDPDDLCGADACAFREGHNSPHCTIYGVPFTRTTGPLCATRGCVMDPHPNTSRHLDDTGTWFDSAADPNTTPTMCSATRTDSEGHLITGSCTLDTGHGSYHEDTNHWWGISNIIPRSDHTCPTEGCIRTPHHQGPHVDKHGDEDTKPNPTCGHHDPNSDATCNRTHGHNGPHTIGDGTTQWSTDPCPIDSIATPGGKWCILNRGHDGPCYNANKGEQIHRCTTTAPGTPGTIRRCALATGHFTDRLHVNINGIEWNTND